VLFRHKCDRTQPARYPVLHRAESWSFRLDPRSSTDDDVFAGCRRSRYINEFRRGTRAEGRATLARTWFLHFCKRAFIFPLNGAKKGCWWFLCLISLLIVSFSFIFIFYTRVPPTERTRKGNAFYFIIMALPLSPSGARDTTIKQHFRFSVSRRTVVQFPGPGGN